MFLVKDCPSLFGSVASFAPLKMEAMRPLEAVCAAAAVAATPSFALLKLGEGILSMPMASPKRLFFLGVKGRTVTSPDFGLEGVTSF